jgi:tRNA A22 N-methylase
MGGEEIIKILKNAFIPKNFLFQPMKNARALRQYLLDNGCALTVDDMFFDGYKYYSVIRGARESGEQGENYTENMLAFGRDSLKNPLLKNYLSHKIERINSYLENEMTTDSKISLTAKLNFLKETLKQCN